MLLIHFYDKRNLYFENGKFQSINIWHGYNRP